MGILILCYLDLLMGKTHNLYTALYKLCYRRGAKALVIRTLSVTITAMTDSLVTINFFSFIISFLFVTWRNLFMLDGQMSHLTLSDKGHGGAFKHLVASHS